MDFNTSRKAAFTPNVYKINNFIVHLVVGIVLDVWSKEGEKELLKSSLHFLLPRALQMTHLMDLFAIYLSEALAGRNYELHGGCTSNASLRLPWWCFWFA